MRRKHLVKLAEIKVRARRDQNKELVHGFCLSATGRLYRPLWVISRHSTLNVLDGSSWHAFPLRLSLRTRGVAAVCGWKFHLLPITFLQGSHTHPFPHTMVQNSVEILRGCQD